jgi:hypothetical protein
LKTRVYTEKGSENATKKQEKEQEAKSGRSKSEKKNVQYKIRNTGV